MRVLEAERAALLRDTEMAEEMEAQYAKRGTLQVGWEFGRVGLSAGRLVDWVGWFRPRRAPLAEQHSSGSDAAVAMGAWVREGLGGLKPLHSMPSWSLSDPPTASQRHPPGCHTMHATQPPSIPRPPHTHSSRPLPMQSSALSSNFKRPSLSTLSPLPRIPDCQAREIRDQRSKITSLEKGLARMAADFEAEKAALEASLRAQLADTAAEQNALRRWGNGRGGCGGETGVGDECRGMAAVALAAFCGWRARDGGMTEVSFVT